MYSVSAAFNVHYNQKLGDPSGHLGGTHNGLWGIDARGFGCAMSAITVLNELTVLLH